jgi:hypothetical protein
MGDTAMQPIFAVMTRYGEEGIDWDYPDKFRDLSSYTVRVPGMPFSIITYDDANFWGGTAVANRSWRQAGPLYYENGIYVGQGYGPGTPERTLRTGAAILKYMDPVFQPKEVIPKLIFNESELNEVDELMATLRSYLAESTSNFLAGNRDIDATWNTYINDINNIGLSRVLNTVQRVYDRMYK